MAGLRSARRRAQLRVWNIARLRSARRRAKLAMERLRLQGWARMQDQARSWLLLGSEDYLIREFPI